ncbi:MAG: DUF4856 domain-containing protein [Pseudomonadota bacterium]
MRAYVKQKRLLASASAALLTGLLPSPVTLADDKVYGSFPVTVKGYAGKKKTSVSYTGQIARQVLHDSLKKLAGKGNGKPNAALKAQMMSYYASSDAGRAIIAPKTKGPFVIKQTTVDEISKKKNLGGKTYKGVVTGMPGGKTGKELVEFWIDKAATAPKGVDMKNGYHYPQLISKFILGAVMYNQAVDNYLDELLSADKKPNDKPYKDGAAYTGKEHIWDEAFGYFGAPTYTLKLKPADVVAIAQQKPEAMRLADVNGDGKIDLNTEMTFGPAYYAAGFDASSKGKTTYLHTITQAFLDGRKLITSAKGEKLTDAQRAKLKEYAAVIADNWQAVLAETVYKYAGSVYKDMTKLKTIIEANGDTSKVFKDYVKHWSELKGFSLALQTGKENLGETTTALNRLIGIGPQMLDETKVVFIDRNGDYLRDQSMTWGDYMVRMARVQNLMAENFGVKARNNAISGDIAELAAQLGASNSAETD